MNVSFHGRIRLHNFCQYWRKMTSPQSVKQIDSVKENIPPATTMENLFHQNGFLMEKQCQATPKKCAQSEDPVTPNTNFKMFTSLAAELAYANCSTPKSRNSNDALVLFDNRTCDDTEIVFHPPSRKEKSLSIICTRFLSMYPLYPSPEKSIIVSLDEASVNLGIERRRLYDIVNVFESIEMLKKSAKNQYIWFGKNNLVNALFKLKAAALKESVLEKLQYVLKFEENLSEVRQSSCILDDVQNFNKNFEIQKSSSLTPEILRYPSPLPELRKEKSLAIMSQKFLMLFLVSPSKIISLGVAAKVLNGFQNNEKGAQIKTQIRRLYDIANVLSSIGLIQKEVTISQNGKKPAFKYIGPDLADGLEASSKEVREQASRSNKYPQKLKPKNLVRHSSFQEICAVAEIEREKIYFDEMPQSAPPFEKCFQDISNTPDKTSFSHLKLNADFSAKQPDVCKNTNHFKDLKTLPLLQNGESKVLGTETRRPQASLKSVSLPGQSSLKLINVPKQILAANGPYYILNPSSTEIMRSPTPMGTVLLISPLPANKPVKENNCDKVPKNKVPSSQTLQISTEQRDMILKSLNLSLSAGQIAAIQLEGSSKSPTSDIKPRCNLLKIIEKHEEIITSANEKAKYLSKDIYDIESNESSCFSSNRDNSPSNSLPRFDSPLSLPSGYVTPVNSASSDISLTSISESNAILKKIKIENQTDYVELPVKYDFFGQNFQTEIKYELKNDLHKFFVQPLTGEKRKNEDIRFLNRKPSLPLKDIHNLSPVTNSCSSDSLNREVSEIFKGENLGNSAKNLKPFLIDEKTILSPIKKHKGDSLSKPLTASSFITPPYTVHDTYFEFNKLPLATQISDKAFSFPLLLKIGNTTKNADSKTDFPA